MSSNLTHTTHSTRLLSQSLAQSAAQIRQDKHIFILIERHISIPLLVFRVDNHREIVGPSTTLLLPLFRVQQDGWCQGWRQRYGAWWVAAHSVEFLGPPARAA